MQQEEDYTCDRCGEPCNFECIYSETFRARFCCKDCRDGFKSLFTLGAGHGGGGGGGHGGGHGGGGGGHGGHGAFGGGGGGRRGILGGGRGIMPMIRGGGGGRAPLRPGLFGPRRRGIMGGMNYFRRYGGHGFRSLWGVRYPWARYYYDYPYYHPFWYLLSLHPIGDPFWNNFGYYPMNDPYWNQYDYYGDESMYGHSSTSSFLSSNNTSPESDVTIKQKEPNNVVVFEKRISPTEGYLLTADNLYNYIITGENSKNATLDEKLFASIIITRKIDEQQWCAMTSLLSSVCHNEENTALLASVPTCQFNGYLEGNVCSLGVDINEHSKVRQLECTTLQRLIGNVINGEESGNTLNARDILFKESKFDYTAETEKGVFINSEGSIFDYECERDLPLREQALFAVKRNQNVANAAAATHMKQLQSMLAKLSPELNTLTRDVKSATTSQELLIGYNAQDEAVVVHGKGAFNAENSLKETADEILSLYSKVVSY